MIDYLGETWNILPAYRKLQCFSWVTVGDPISGSSTRLFRMENCWNPWSIPNAPWDWNIHLYIWFKFMLNAGKYCIPVEPLRFSTLRKKWEKTCWKLVKWYVNIYVNIFMWTYLYIYKERKTYDFNHMQVHASKAIWLQICINIYSMRRTDPHPPPINECQTANSISA